METVIGASGGAGSATGIISIAIVSVFLIVVIIHTLQGLRRGWRKQSIHALCTVESAIFSFIIVKALTNALINALGTNVQTVGDMLASAGMNGDIARYMNGMNWLVAMPVSVIVAPFAFVTFFVIAVIFAKIMYYIVKKLLSLPKKPSAVRERLIGLPIGAIEGILFCSIVLIPAAGIFGIVDDGVNAIREKDNGKYTAFIDRYDENISPLANNIAFRTARACGGDAILDSFATFEDGDDEINLRDEIVPAVSVAVELGSIEDFDMKSVTQEQKDVISSAVDTLESSEYLTVLLSGVLSGMASAVEDGVIPFESEPPFDKLINSVIALFATSDKNNLTNDIRSMLNIYYILSDEGVLLAFDEGVSEEIRDLLITRDASGKTLVNKIVDELNANEHTKPLVSTFTELSVALISSAVGIDGDTAQIYEDVKGGLRDVLTITPSDYPDTEEGHAQYRADLSASLNQTFTDNGIELEDEIVDGIAEYIDTNIEVKDEYTDEEIDNIILSYYDVYVDYVESGETPDDIPSVIPPGGIPDIGIDDFEGGSGTLPPIGDEMEIVPGEGISPEDDVEDSGMNIVPSKPDFDIGIDLEFDDTIF